MHASGSSLGGGAAQVGPVDFGSEVFAQHGTAGLLRVPLDLDASFGRDAAADPVGESLRGHPEVVGHLREADLLDGAGQCAHGALLNATFIDKSTVRVTPFHTKRLAFAMAETPISRALRLARAKGMNQTEFAVAMGVLPQHVTNWKKRGMPPEHHRQAAKVVGITVDELLDERPSVQAGTEPSPTLSPEERRLLEAFHLLPDDEQDELLRDLGRRAERYRVFAERLMRQRGAGAIIDHPETDEPEPLPGNVRAPHFPSTRGRLIPPPTRKHAPAPTKPKSPGKAGGSGGRK